MIDYTVLKNYITSNYSQLVAAGNDQAIVDAMNAPASYVLSIPKIHKAYFVPLIAEAVDRIPNLSTADQAAWNTRISFIFASMGLLTDIEVQAVKTQQFLQGAVLQGLLLQSEVDAVITRNGSAAENLFGIDTVLGQADISFALRGTR